MDCMKRSGGLKKSFCTVIVAVAFIAAPSPAQVAPSAFGPARSLWAGAEYSNLHAGFPYQSDQRLWGIGVFSDYHLNTRIDVEVEARFLRFNSFYGEAEDNYLTGPRYLAGTFRRFQPYGQFLVGLAEMRYPFKIGSRQYFALAPGGGVNYRVGRRWTARAEYEYQLWPGSPDYSNEPAHEITPNGFHIGLAYRLLR